MPPFPGEAGACVRDLSYEVSRGFVVDKEAHRGRFPPDSGQCVEALGLSPVEGAQDDVLTTHKVPSASFARWCDMARPKRLQDELFRLTSSDDQLLLAVALCMTDSQRRQNPRRDRVVGVTAEELWHWLDARTGNARAHPNIDHRWASLGALRAALRRLGKRKLLRASRSDSEWSSALLWRPTDAAGNYLRERRLFTDAA